MVKSIFDDDGETPQAEKRSLFQKSKAPGVTGLFDDPKDEKENFVISEAAPESVGETARRSGLAFSAGVAFFSAVVFMLILGWLADLFLGTSPWGIVAGIVLGAVIGFIQLFRVSSEIFRKQ